VIRAFRRILTLCFLLSLLLPIFAAHANAPAGTRLFSDLWHKAAILIFLVVCWLFAFYCFLRRLEPYLEKEAQEHANFLDSLPAKYVSAAIILSASLSLCLELAVIRWQGTTFEFFAFYQNYGLLACFAGLGLGYALAKSRDGIPLNLTPCLFGWQFGLLMLLRFGLSQQQMSTFETVPFSEQLNMGLRVGKTNQFVAVYLLLSVVFLLTALAFIPIGQVCGRVLLRKTQLSAYGLNLLGSLLGVLLMVLLSYLWTPPVIWFAVCFFGLLFFWVRRPRSLLLGAGFTIVCLSILSWPIQPMWHRVYSPYQLLEFGYGQEGLMVVRAAGHYYQRVHNLSGTNIAADPKLKRIADYYEFPFRVHPLPIDVMVVGAGTGNDVAAALRGRAEHVDAIEIDPAILGAGRAAHPERPYQNPRVQAVVDDARTYLRNTKKTYDVIVYGLLDSHTLLSQASSVRLDSFVYTVEAFREARSRLKPGGTLSLSFSVLNDQLGKKIFQMLKEAFDGKEPICVRAEYDGSVIFLESNSALPNMAQLEAQTGFTDATSFYRNSEIEADVSTDDWPFFYMPRRVYPVSYLIVLALVLFLSLVLTACFLRGGRVFGNFPFLFLGAGFMLVETKGITEMGLVFGNTWQVIAIVIASILLMVFLANCVVQWLKIKSPIVPFVLLFASLVFGWSVARSGGLPSTMAGRIETAIVLTCPMFFSGIVFSTLLTSEEEISSVMAMNLLGAMCGGVLEYNSMYFGFHFLYLIAIGLYAGAILSTFRIWKWRATRVGLVPEP
jgi:spermidine synthase